MERSRVKSMAAGKTRRIAFGTVASIFISAYQDSGYGEWIDLPCSDEKLQSVIERVAGEREFDTRHVLITACEGIPHPDAKSMDPYFLNDLMREVNDAGIPRGAFYQMCRASDDLYGLYGCIASGRFDYYEDVGDEYELASEIAYEHGMSAIDSSFKNGWSIGGDYAVRLI